MSFFLGSLQSAGITVPQGIAILDRSARLSSEAAPPAASQTESSSGGSSQAGGVWNSVIGPTSVSPVRAFWLGGSVSLGASSSHAASPDIPPRSVSFAKVLAPDDDDRPSVVSEIAHPSDGPYSVMRLFFFSVGSFCGVCSASSTTEGLRI